MQNLEHRRAAVDDYNEIDVRPFAPHLGAEVRGVVLADGVSESQFRELHRAFRIFPGIRPSWAQQDARVTRQTFFRTRCVCQVQSLPGL